MEKKYKQSYVVKIGYFHRSFISVNVKSDQNFINSMYRCSSS